MTGLSKPLRDPVSPESAPVKPSGGDSELPVDCADRFTDLFFESDLFFGSNGPSNPPRSPVTGLSNPLRVLVSGFRMPSMGLAATFTAGGSTTGTVKST